MPWPAPPWPAPTTAWNNPTTTNQGGGGNTDATRNGNGANTSSSVNGGGNASNSNSASGNTAAPSGALPTPLNGFHSGGSGSYTTTLSNGSVLVLPAASFAPGDSSETQSSTSSANIPTIIGAVLGLIFLFALIILLLLWRRKKRAQTQVGILGAETPPREFSMARAINTNSRLHVASALGLENGADISETSMREAVAGGSVWVMSNKARMYAEEAMPGTSDTDLSSIEPSNYTTLHPQQTRNALNHGGRDAVVPSLSPGDIHRLAESIVARMQGRDPALRERIFEEVRSSVVTEDEPPPPWSAPGVNAYSL